MSRGERIRTAGCNFFVHRWPVLGYYDMLNADATKETTEAMFEAAKRSAEIERNLDEVDKEYKRQVKEMEEVKNPRIYMEADGLRAAHRTVLILLIHCE